MNNERLQIFLDSHGADPARWPATERATPTMTMPPPRAC
jgi:hypothetical protein